MLGGDGTNAFSTLLATGHKFNGWADKFLSTPVNGLEDLYFGIMADLSGVHKHLENTKAKVIYHDYSAENGGADYGTEWNAVITKKFAKKYAASLKYASYDADSFSNDTSKLWLTLGYKF